MTDLFLIYRLFVLLFNLALECIVYFGEKGNEFWIRDAVSSVVSDIEWIFNQKCLKIIAFKERVPSIASPFTSS